MGFPADGTPLSGQFGDCFEPVPPFRLNWTVWVLGRRPDNVVDRWDGHTYRRVLLAGDDQPFEIAVSQSGPLEAGKRENVTLLYSARDTEHNNALVLKSFLERRMKT